MMAGAKAVTIVIPVLDEERALPRLIAALAALDPQPAEIIAVDGGNLRANEQTEGLYLADLYFFARWQPVRVVQMMVDCPGGRRADPMGGDGGAPVWREVGAQDPVLRTVCEEAGA